MVQGMYKNGKWKDDPYSEAWDTGKYDQIRDWKFATAESTAAMTKQQFIEMQRNKQGSWEQASPEPTRAPTTKSTKRIKRSDKTQFTQEQLLRNIYRRINNRPKTVSNWDLEFVRKHDTNHGRAARQLDRFAKYQTTPQKTDRPIVYPYRLPRVPKYTPNPDGVTWTRTLNRPKTDVKTPQRQSTRKPTTNETQNTTTSTSKVSRQKTSNQKKKGKKVLMAGNNQAGGKSSSSYVKGRPVKVNEKNVPVTQFKLYGGNSVFSGNSSNANAVNNIQQLTSSGMMWALTKRNDGTALTSSTAYSGCKAIFCTMVATPYQMFNSTDSSSVNNSWFSAVPNWLTNSSQTAPLVPFHLTVRTEVVNTTNINCTLTMLDYEYRYDTTTTGMSGVTNPITLWAKGYLDLSTSPSSSTSVVTPSLTDIGTSPFSSPIFTHFIKVMKKRSVNLSPGAVHVHTHTVHNRKSFTKINASLVTNAIAGLTGGTLFYATGQTVESTGGSPGALTPGIVDLNVTQTLDVRLYEKKGSLRNVISNQDTFYQNTQGVGVFKALIDNSRVWSVELEGG